jgi:hypothetical protein
LANGIGDLLRLGRFPGARPVESSGNAIGEGVGDVAHDIELERGVEDSVVSIREAAGDEPITVSVMTSYFSGSGAASPPVALGQADVTLGGR